MFLPKHSSTSDREMLYLRIPQAASAGTEMGLVGKSPLLAIVCWQDLHNVHAMLFFISMVSFS